MEHYKTHNEYDIMKKLHFHFAFLFATIIGIFPACEDLSDHYTVDISSALGAPGWVRVDSYVYFISGINHPNHASVIHYFSITCRQEASDSARREIQRQGDSIINVCKKYHIK